MITMCSTAGGALQATNQRALENQKEERRDGLVCQGSLYTCRPECVQPAAWNTPSMYSGTWGEANGGGGTAGSSFSGTQSAMLGAQQPQLRSVSCSRAPA